MTINTILTNQSKNEQLFQLNARKLKYDFHSVEGIIFGMNTSVADKIRIVRIIEQKCRQAGRTDFCFYQAHYSHESGLIDKHKISGLSFAPTE